MKKSTKNTLRNVAIGTGIVAAVGAAAYAVKDNPKVKKVADKMKKEIVTKAKKAQVATKHAYEKIATEVADKYKKATQADIWSVLDVGREVKEAWDHMKEVVTSASKETKKTVKKVKAAVKTRGKSTKKTA